jgi:hypothetical protein
VISDADAGGIALVAVGLALTPGPNLLYLVSRSLSQGTRAGLVTLAECHGRRWQNSAARQACFSAADASCGHCFAAAAAPSAQPAGALRPA